VGDLPDSLIPSRDVTPCNSSASWAPSPVGDDYPSVLRVSPTPSLEDDDLSPTLLPSPTPTLLPPPTPYFGDDAILLSPEAAIFPPVRADDFDLFDDPSALRGDSMALVPYFGPLFLGKIFISYSFRLICIVFVLTPDLCRH